MNSYEDMSKVFARINYIISPGANGYVSTVMQPYEKNIFRRIRDLNNFH